MTVDEALHAALSVEHQLVYGYGLAAAHLGGRRYRAALAALTDAKARRDQLAELLRRRAQVPAPAAPAYLPPAPVRDAPSAIALCLRLEHAAEGAAWDVVAASGPNDKARQLGVSWLAASAVRAAYWAGRSAAEEPPLPGRPG